MTGRRPRREELEIRAALAANLGDRNPWRRETWSPDEQLAVFVESPSKTVRLAKAAGSALGEIEPPDPDDLLDDDDEDED